MPNFLCEETACLSGLRLEVKKRLVWGQIRTSFEDCEGPIVVQWLFYRPKSGEIGAGQTPAHPISASPTGWQQADHPQRTVPCDCL